MISVLCFLLQDTPEESSTTVLGSVYNAIFDGGWMMVPIAISSVVAFAFFIERCMALTSARLLPQRLEEELGRQLERSPADALRFCAEFDVPAARIVGAGLRRWAEPRLQIEKAVEDAGAREVAQLSGNLRPLVVVASVAPLLGLLGTVLGMIQAFTVIATEKGIGKPEMLADGISQALITTAAGLIVAIPAQVGYYFLKARIDRFVRRLENLFASAVGPELDARARSAA